MEAAAQLASDTEGEKPERELAPFETNFTDKEKAVIRAYRRFAEVHRKAGSHQRKLAGKAKFDEYV